MIKATTAAAFCTAALFSLATAWASVPAAVTVVDEGETYRLANREVTAVVSKASGGLLSLKYRGLETLHVLPGRDGGKWSHDARSDNTTARITIDPATNGGTRAEVAIKGLSNGKPMGAGPGGSAVADIEIRYCIDDTTPGVYTYSQWTHRPEYPATNVGEARFYVKLNDDVFDWITVDADRNRKALTAFDWNHGEVLNAKEIRRLTTGIYKGEVEHKYTLSASQFENLAWGWSSTTHNVGVWFVNPTTEYLSGGPTKIELSAHRDATFTPTDKTAPAPPCILNYWRSSHYGGSVLFVDKGEAWTKVVGPFLIYCNSGPTPDAMWKDALARSQAESRDWPKDWVSGVDYPTSSQRGSATGRLTLDDPFAPGAMMSNLLVGLVPEEYEVPAGRDGAAVRVNWLNDAKHYQFWARAAGDGTFDLKAVRPGRYALRAIADGVLGEFVGGIVEIKPGGRLDLGSLRWHPARHGPTLWEIGTPNRKASEFRYGDRYWHWGNYLQYPKDFPNDVDFVIGKSDPRTDWNYAHVPRATDDVAKTPGTVATWKVRFDLAELPPDGAVLRLAFSGSGGAAVEVALNGTPAGSTGVIPRDSTIHRDAIQGMWTQREIELPASLFRTGENSLTLTVPAGPVTTGVVYDYVRLERKAGK